jgi:hypothetical protein
MNKKLLSPVMVLALVFAMTVLGCPESEEGDTWSTVKSLNQLNGTWKGTYNVFKNKPMKEVVEEAGGEWDPIMGAVLGNIKLSVKLDITTTINASAQTQALLVTTTTTYSGGNTKTLWATVIKPGLQTVAQEEGINITFDDKNHSSTMVLIDSPAERMSQEEIDDLLSRGFKINQDGKKIKIPANSMMQGLPEMIFTKQ